LKCDPETYFRYEISSFIIKYGLPAELSDKLAFLVNGLAQKLTIANLQSFYTSRYYTSLFNNSICQCLQRSYLEKLETEKFSLAIDSATSEGNEEYLAINARYFASKDSLTTTTTLLGLVPLKANSSGQAIFDLLTRFLFTGEEGSIRKKNLFGISSGGATNMISKRSAGVTNRLLIQLPNIVVIHDLCHVFNLVIKNCINTFPKVHRDIISDISTTFTSSAKKSARFKELLKGNGEKLLAIKRFIPTRWKSFFDCLDRIIHLNQTLKLFFNSKENNDLTNQTTQDLNLRRPLEVEEEEDKNRDLGHHELNDKEKLEEEKPQSQNEKEQMPSEEEKEFFDSNQLIELKEKKRNLIKLSEKHQKTQASQKPQSINKTKNDKIEIEPHREIVKRDPKLEYILRKQF